MASSTSDPLTSEATQGPSLDDLDRHEDICSKHAKLAELLESQGWDALLLQRPCNFSWMTSGSGIVGSGSALSTAALFITADSRLIATNNCDSPLLFEEEVPQLGFSLKERSWTESSQVLIDDLCRGRVVASDTGCQETVDASSELRDLRLCLTPLERARMRIVGRHVAHAVEATARTLEPGQTEAEIAGQLAHRLIHRQVAPERLQVMVDGRGDRYRHWSYGADPLRKNCVLSAVGSRWGLCAAAARTVSFGAPSRNLRSQFQTAVMAEATGIYFSQPGMSLSRLFGRVSRIYEKYGHDKQWRLCDQGDVIGYQPSELPITPGSRESLAVNMAVHWHPSVGSAMTGDTILVAENGYEPLRPAETWPQMAVSVKGFSVDCPDLLTRDP